MRGKKKQNTYTVPEDQAQALIKNAMKAGWLLWIKCSAWGNRKKLAKELMEEKFGNDVNKINATQKLLDQDVVARVTGPMNQAQTFARELALPWFHDGIYYILERDMQYLEDLLQKWEKESKAGLEELIERYESLKKAEFYDDPRLYNEDNYPTTDELRAKFNFRWGWQKVSLPVEEGQELSVVSKKVVQNENKKFQEQMKELAEEGIAAVRTSFLEIITHLRDCLKDPDKKFQEATVEKPKEFLKRFASINIYGDKPFEDVSKDIGEILSGVYAEDLRDDSFYRRSIGKAMDDVVEVFEDLPTVRLERAVDF